MMTILLLVGQVGIEQERDDPIEAAWGHASGPISSVRWDSCLTGRRTITLIQEGALDLLERLVHRSPTRTGSRSYFDHRPPRPAPVEHQVESRKARGRVPVGEQTAAPQCPAISAAEESQSQQAHSTFASAAGAPPARSLAAAGGDSRSHLAVVGEQRLPPSPAVTISGHGRRARHIDLSIRRPGLQVSSQTVGAVLDAGMPSSSNSGPATAFPGRGRARDRSRPRRRFRRRIVRIGIQVTGVEIHRDRSGTHLTQGREHVIANVGRNEDLVAASDSMQQRAAYNAVVPSRPPMHTSAKGGLRWSARAPR